MKDHELLVNWEQKSKNNQNNYKKLLQKIDKKAAIKSLNTLHDEAFEKVDCLECANCCKNYSPRFKSPDIRRIAKYLGQKEGEFIQNYLRLDEDGDYVLTSKPCLFLNPTDNTCLIYDVRPSDCSRFPYTDEDILLKKPSLTLKNSTFCPAVYFVLEKLSVIKF
jgi:uncharacterized protein